MEDDTEEVRRAMQAEINAVQADRARLEAEYGQVWNTEELTRDFAVTGFAAPFVLARRKSDGVEGSLMFQHHPRFYWGWQVRQES